MNTVEGVIFTIVETIESSCNSVLQFIKDIPTKHALRKVAKAHKKFRIQKDKEEAILRKITIRSYMITSMNDFNNKNKASWAAMDKFGKFRRVR